ncbi:MAG: histidine kinase [Sulfuricurvum sp. PC08-66]|nr:MAG: histidine kinase [Sulfuricurvum sp. PC08-66]
MLSKRSIRSRFILQILVASAGLLIIFSSILYVYIQQSIFDEKRRELIHLAQNVVMHTAIDQPQQFPNETLGVTIDLVTIQEEVTTLLLGERTINNEHFLVLYYPFDSTNKSYIRITKEFTSTKKLLNRILNSIFIINAISFLFVVVYAFAFANMLIAPITALTTKLSKMNENFMNNLDIARLPIEFMPLGESVNNLINRIQTFVRYQKELFIGAAHELKTPLAVMKLKNEVTLIKTRESDKYIEALKTNIDSINQMNKIVADILNVGRQEGAHFEKPVTIDVIAFLHQKSSDFKLLAEHENKQLIIDLKPNAYIMLTQPSLINQIVQNFLQNALKFTPEGKSVSITSCETDYGLEICVEDEGCGIDEHMDHFAPFKRSGNKSGVGLGLFLAKSAADALNATINLRNREDGKGAKATLILCSSLVCLLPKKKPQKSKKE